MTIAILDFGSQYTQLIARRIREMHVFSEILPHDVSVEQIRAVHPVGIILSGGPKSPHEEALEFDPTLFDLAVPILGVCYGMQLMNQLFGGTVQDLRRGEYGRQLLQVSDEGMLFRKLESEQAVWMSHRVSIHQLAPGFRCVATSRDELIAAIEHVERPYFGVQFHPEVSHTQEGMAMLDNFLAFCGAERSWTMSSYLEETTERIRQQVGDRPVVSLVSGGVDSTVSTALCAKALGAERVHAIHIDNGLLRTGESDRVAAVLESAGVEKVTVVDASSIFLTALQGLSEPEEKRHVIGACFIEVMEREMRRLGLDSDDALFCQGTLYTDLIESGKGCGKAAAVIKSHHNVNPPIVARKRERNLIVEPNSAIFKDEVREVGELLGLPREVIWCHPFPGPGLAIRIIGEVTEERLALLRRVDDIFLREIRAADLYDAIWQAFAVLLPVKSVGVMGDERTEGFVVALRAICSRDGMTASVYPFRIELLSQIATCIVNEVEGVNRVTYDVTTKPPATVEWE